MEELLISLIYFVVLFVFIFLFYFLILNRIKKKRKRLNRMGEINYLAYKFALDPKKINIKALANVVALVNAFIISFTSLTLSFIKVKFIWQMLIGFVILFGLIYSLYEIVGRICVKKGWRLECTTTKK